MLSNGADLRRVHNSLMDPAVVAGSESKSGGTRRRAEYNVALRFARREASCGTWLQER
jgi:hypothetical protein